MNKFCFAVLLASAFYFQLATAQAANTCKQENGLWYTYCGDVKASDTPSANAALCFKSVKEICPADNSKSTATCKKGKGDLWFVKCSGVQIQDNGYGTSETCFAEAKSACP